MVLCGCLAMLSYALFLRAESFWGFLALLALGSNALQYLNMVGGVVLGRLASGPTRGADYARYRVWGSVGYILIGVTAGFLLPSHPGMSRADLRPVFLYGPLLFLVIAALSLLLPDPKAPPSTSQEASVRTPLPAGLKHFFVAYFCYQFALYGATTYLPLFMKSLGATPREVSLMFAAGVLCEVLVMSQVGRWTDRVGRKPALLSSFILMPIRLLLYIPATSPGWVMAVQALHGINYGIVGTIAVVSVNDWVNDSQRGVAQATLGAVSGAALSLSPALCGWLTEIAGFGGMFATMSAIGVVGAIYLYRKVPESNPR
jgi:MFS transporter, PPP family, 3-phenylpropionic acid transporter